MAFDTTTHTDYIRHEGAEPPPRALKPVIQAWGTERPIAASNRHASHHAVPSATTRGRPAERRLPGKPHQHQGETEGSRAATTYRSNYTSTKSGTKTGHRNAHKSPPVWKPCGIANSANPTSTRRARTPNPRDGKAPACPASFTEPPGYQDTRTTVSGHRMFQRTLSGAEDGPGKRGVATVATNGQSQQPQRRGHSTGSATAVVADGRGRGQH
ncbi:uncharacterized protein LOC134437922 [Engraulis encrasicolus]|uniref:uncharacterized protein LOC134437922 n=1 Tax=Engraulis encrasicolus TaxID=184585 RepID=UPI002FD283F7